MRHFRPTFRWRTCVVLAAMLAALPACQHRTAITPAAREASTPPSSDSEPLLPSPRLIVGRVLAVDAERHFAFVDIAEQAPLLALVDGTDLTARTLQLRETAQLRASSYLRGRTLGTRIVSGQPSPGDEVVWRVP
jgi:hypothetical protein